MDLPRPCQIRRQGRRKVLFFNMLQIRGERPWGRKGEEEGTLSCSFYNKKDAEKKREGRGRGLSSSAKDVKAIITEKGKEGNPAPPSLPRTERGQKKEGEKNKLGVFAFTFYSSSISNRGNYIGKKEKRKGV